MEGICHFKESALKQYPLFEWSRSATGDMSYKNAYKLLILKQLFFWLPPREYVVLKIHGMRRVLGVRTPICTQQINSIHTPIPLHHIGRFWIIWDVREGQRERIGFEDRDVQNGCVETNQPEWRAEHNS